MRLLASFVAYEARTQLRSLRFRLAAGAYAAIGSLPALLVYVESKRSDLTLGAATYAAEVATLLPFASALLATLLSLDGILRERQEGVWTVLGLAPITNAGYLLRRWLALLAVLLPVSLLPLAVAAALATLAGAPPGAAGPFLGPWLLHVVPVLVAGSALALGLGTILDNAIAAGVALYLAVLLVPGAMNALLAPAGHQLTSPVEWLGLKGIRTRLFYFQLASHEKVAGLRYVLPATEGAFDLRTAAEMQSPPAAVPLGLALAALGLAVPYLRRSRPDLRPRRVRDDHPLRSFLAAANRLRQRYAPDPARAPFDRVLQACGLAALACGVAYYLARDTRFHRLAAARYAVETAGWPSPTPAAVSPLVWRLRAELGSDGIVRSTVEGSFRNEGAAPCPHLAFELDPQLALRSLGSDLGTARYARRWDRLAVELAPPLAPGESRRLRFELAGAPAQVFFNLKGAADANFITAYRLTVARRRAADLTDLSSSWTRRSASPRRVDLAARDLLPVPRYTPWALTGPGSDEDHPGGQVPPEQAAPQADLAFEIRAPRSSFLAEACGASTWETPGRLAGRCRVVLGEWSVFGGPLRPARLGGVRFATLPQHRERARFHAASLATLAGQIGEAWPGLTLPEPIVLEWSPGETGDPFLGMGLWSPWSDFELPEPKALGGVLLLPERFLVANARISSAALAATTIADALNGRRTIAIDQRPLLRSLFSALALRRLGLGPASGATLAGRWYQLPAFKISLLEREQFNRETRDLRTAAIVADLENRLGAAAVQRGVEAFLARQSAAPGTLEELFEDLGRAGGLSLALYYQDFLAGDALPQLALAHVRVERGDPWRVHGSLENHGAGHARCPVVITTEFGPLREDLEVGPEGSTDFTIASRFPPRTVRLDPDRSCFRFAPTPAGPLVDRVDLASEAGR